MDKNLIIPIALFACIAYVFKLVVEAYTRRKMFDSPASQEWIRSALEGEDASRRQSSLRWGLIMVALAIGFGLMELFRLSEPTPGMFAILLGVTGVAQLTYFFLARRMR